MSGKFTVKKTKRAFSAIAIDHAHEQNNAYVKGDGGAVGLTEDPDALRRWMLSGPEVARVISEFKYNSTFMANEQEEIRHHEQKPSTQLAFKEQLSSLIASIDEMGNPFMEESADLIALGTKEIADPSVVVTVNEIKHTGQEKYNLFLKDRLVDRKTPFTATIPKNKLPLFRSDTMRVKMKVRSQLTEARSDCSLFSKLYIGCQTRGVILMSFSNTKTKHIHLQFQTKEAYVHQRNLT